MSVEDYYESKLIRINSRDRIIPANSTSNFTVNISSFQNEVYDVKKIVCKSISLYNMTYNFTAADTLKIDHNAVNYTYTFEAGRYSWGQISALLVVWMSGILGEAVSFVEDPIKKRITITSIAQTFAIDATNSTAWHRLGFLNDTPLALVQIADQAMDLVYPKNLYFSSRVLAEGNLLDSDNSSHSTFADLHCEAAFGELIKFQSNEESNLSEITYKHQRKLNLIDIRVLDDNDEIVNLQGADVIIVLKVYY